MKRKLAKPDFVPWMPFRQAMKHQAVEQPGVYVVATLKNPSSQARTPLARRAVYIGMSVGRNGVRPLRIRLAAFRRAARGSRSAHHSGGQRYRKMRKQWYEKRAVFLISCRNIPKRLRPYYIRYLERKLILEHVLKYGKAPKLNAE